MVQVKNACVSAGNGCTFVEVEYKNTIKMGNTSHGDNYKSSFVVFFIHCDCDHKNKNLHQKKKLRV